jgi:hypothetical protein
MCNLLVFAVHLCAGLVAGPASGGGGDNPQFVNPRLRSTVETRPNFTQEM